MADETEDLPAALPFTASDVDFDLWESAASTVIVEKLGGGRFREKMALRRFERNGPMQRLAARRAIAMYTEAKPDADVGDVQSFMEWLIANWESILKMVMSIIALFSV